jgi:hypothetical protein
MDHFSCMDYLKNILTDFELHHVEGIKECFKKGVDPNTTHEGKPLIYALINMYTRGQSFKKCIKAFVDHNLEFEDNVLLAVLLDDSVWLDKQLSADKLALTKTYSLDCTFTYLVLKRLSNTVPISTLWLESMKMDLAGTRRFFIL